MAATLTTSGERELTYVSFPIDKSKTEETGDGGVIVYGKATDGSVDSDEQIVDSDWSAKALQDWFSTGPNVRVMHNPTNMPAGSGIEIEVNKFGDGAHWVRSVVDDPVAAMMVRKGHLRAYSVGIARANVQRDISGKARGGIIKGGELVELSLVDRPANRNCGVELLKRAKDGHAEWVGKAFGSDILTKSAGGDMITMDLPKDVSVSFSPADLAKFLAHRHDTEKRQMDPNVGGGVDRDKIPAEDFAGPDRSFPIVTPKDVADIAPNLNHPNLKGDPAQIKQRAIAIARRKGPEFEARIPDSWKNGDDSANKSIENDYQPKPYDANGEGKGEPVTCPNCGKGDAADAKFCDQCGFHLVGADDVAVKGKKPFPGAAKPFAKDDDGDGKPERGEFDEDKGHDDNDDDDDDDGKDDEAEPEVTKGGGKDCPECGKTYHADSKLRNCENCGHDLPNADDTTKGTDGGDVKARAVCDCDKKPGAKKAFCSNCGGKNPNFDVAKSGKPTVGSSSGAVGAGGTQPVPAHREPDGTAIESLEHDAGLPTVPDAEVKTAMRLKSLGVPTDIGAVHDLLCPAYHPDAATRAHPSVNLSGMDVSAWQKSAEDAVYGSDLELASKAARVWQHAVTIKSTPPDILEGLRHEAHKSFTDANPGPGTYPAPTELSAQRFRRPYITDGHANLGTGYAGPNTASIPDSSIQAAQYTRDYITDGHAAESPSNKGQIAQHSYYTNAQRDTARSAMTSMHDHITRTFPDLCPMSAPSNAPEPTTGQNPVPVPAGAQKGTKSLNEVRNDHDLPEGERVDWEKRARELEAELATVRKGAGTTSVTDTQNMSEVVQKAVADASAGLLSQFTAQFDTLTKALKTEKKRNKRLEETVEKLENRPDTSNAPLRGIGLDYVTKASVPPVGVPTVAETAERTQAAFMNALHEEARTSPDPAVREAAWQRLYQMNGLIK